MVSLNDFIRLWGRAAVPRCLVPGLGLWIGWFVFGKSPPGRSASKDRDEKWEGILREAGSQGEVTQLYCQVVQNKAHPTYSWRADVKASSL